LEGKKKGKRHWQERKRSTSGRTLESRVLPSFVGQGGKNISSISLGRGKKGEFAVEESLEGVKRGEGETRLRPESAYYGPERGKSSGFSLSGQGGKEGPRSCRKKKGKKRYTSTE